MALVLGAAIGGPAGAEETRSLVRVEGWIVDSYCRGKNANPEGAQDSLECVKKGAKLILLADDGTTYWLENQEVAAKHLGKKVHVFGMVDGERNLRAGNYISDQDFRGAGDRPGELREDGLVRREVAPGEKKESPPKTSPDPEKKDDAPQP
ncbi:MAG: hypothetical protein GTN89_00570 [Acidobacteria bacterium]|nr:hypothetical protein [Acidobacteriota bacterium]NIO57882.1 hypothetical protein [Acidobacteriota bacterium]NIQ28891.1 hypothetical protein [Acidobacteriota bacterium]